MQYFVNFDVNGNIIGFYNSEIHGGTIPVTAVPITTVDWQKFSSDAERYKRDGLIIREKTQAELDAEQAALPPSPPSEIEELKARQADIILAMVMNDLM